MTDGMERLKELRRLINTETNSNGGFDPIAKAAAKICNAPFAMISVVDATRQWFLCRFGDEMGEAASRDSFCALAIQSREQIFVVADALNDSRFAENPFVSGRPFVRFYAGAPIVSTAGHPLGAVCVFDFKPRQLDASQIEDLRLLALETVAMLESRATR